MAVALPLLHFAILSLSYYVCNYSITLTATTNNPCHLTFYYTSKPPQKHNTSIVRRGLSIAWAAYWCFVAWHTIEQSEPGDTTTHTFIIPTWMIGQQYWFAFFGTVSAVPCSSVSAIFDFTPEQDTLFSNGSFDTWPDPTSNPPSWEPVTAGPGPSYFYRENFYTHEPPYAALFITQNTGTVANYRQTSCITAYRHALLTISAWTRTIGYGQPRIYIQIGPYPYEGVTWGIGPTGWYRFSRTFSIQSHHTYLRLVVGSFSPRPDLSTVVWDQILLSPPP